MTKWLAGVLWCCGFGSLAHAAAIEAIYTEGQGLLLADQTTLPTAVIQLSGDTAAVRLDLRNDGRSSPGLFALPAFIFNVGSEPWDSVTFSLQGDGVTFVLAPAVAPFRAVELDDASKVVTATGEPLLPGGSVFPVFFLSAADNGGDAGTPFSVDLVITVPEPSVAIALSLAALVGCGYRFRKKTGSPLSTSAT